MAPEDISRAAMNLFFISLGYSEDFWSSVISRSAFCQAIASRDLHSSAAAPVHRFPSFSTVCARRCPSTWRSGFVSFIYDTSPIRNLLEMACTSATCIMELRLCVAVFASTVAASSPSFPADTQFYFASGSSTPYSASDLSPCMNPATPCNIDNVYPGILSLPDACTAVLVNGTASYG